MRRSKPTYQVAVFAAIAALLFSTWGAGVSLAQDDEHDMDHDGQQGSELTTTVPESTTTTTAPDTGDPYEECRWIDEVLGFCLDDGTRCTSSRLAVEILMSGLGGFPAGPCMELPSSWLLILFSGFGTIGTST